MTFDLASAHLVLAAAPSSTSLATNIRNWVAPLVLLAIGFFVLKFLVQQRFMELVTFVGIGAVVMAIFYYPTLIKDLGEVVKGFFGATA